MSYLNLSPTSPRRLRRAACGRPQRGFSLLEALVSIVILSFGLLGVAGLQATSLKYSRDAGNQSVAVNLAREMAEMIRSNARISGKRAAASNPYLQDEDDIPAEYEPSEDEGEDYRDCLYDPDEKCADDDALAKAQVQDWKYRVKEALPGARIAVCLDETPYDGEGLPQWVCSNTGSVIAIKMGWFRDDFARNDENKLVTKNADEMRPFVVLPVTPAGQQQ